MMKSIVILAGLSYAIWPFSSPEDGVVTDEHDYCKDIASSRIICTADAHEITQPWDAIISSPATDDFLVDALPLRTIIIIVEVISMVVSLWSNFAGIDMAIGGSRFATAILLTLGIFTRIGATSMAYMIAGDSAMWYANISAVISSIILGCFPILYFMTLTSFLINAHRQQRVSVVEDARTIPCTVSHDYGDKIHTTLVSAIREHADMDDPYFILR